jgi:hypothetical protein
VPAFEKPMLLPFIAVFFKNSINLEEMWGDQSSVKTTIFLIGRNLQCVVPIGLK